MSLVISRQLGVVPSGGVSVRRWVLEPAADIICRVLQVVVPAAVSKVAVLSMVGEV